MSKKAIFNPWMIGIGFIGIFIILALFVSANKNGIGIGDSGKPKIVCDVVLKNRLLQDTKIETSSCSVISKCGLFSSIPLAIFTDKGTLVMRVGDKESKKNYAVAESLRTTDEFELSVCSELTSGELIVFNDQGQIINKRSFNV